jgi:hypothetical protein
MTHGEVINFI